MRPRILYNPVVARDTAEELKHAMLDIGESATEDALIRRGFSKDELRKHGEEAASRAYRQLDRRIA